MFDAARKFDYMKNKCAEYYQEITDLIGTLIKEGIDTYKIKGDIDIASLSIEIVSVIDGAQIYSSIVSDVKIEGLLNNFFVRTWESIKIL